MYDCRLYSLQFHWLGNSGLKGYAKPLATITKRNNPYIRLDVQSRQQRGDESTGADGRPQQRYRSGNGRLVKNASNIFN